MIRMLIAGYHGFGNCGDEATLLAMKNNIPAIDENIELTALSFKPEITESLYGIKAVQRFNLRAVLSAIRQCDYIISGGGSLLQDETSTRSILYYLGIIFVSKLMKKKVMLYSNGIGPVSKPFNRLLIRKIVNKVDLITLREESSGEELRKLGVTKPPVYVTADPAFTLKGVSKASALSLLEAEGVPLDKPILGVCIRDWKTSGDFCQVLAEACDAAVEAHHMNVLFIPMQYPADLAISEKVSSKMNQKSYILRGKYNSDETLGIIGCVALMLSMRLHALIFAAVQRVPMLGIIYDPKVAYYLDVLEMPSCGDVRKEALKPEAIADLLEQMLGGYEMYRAKLDRLAGELSQKAAYNEVYLKEMVRGRQAKERFSE